jgi:hypothetical protein
MKQNKIKAKNTTAPSPLSFNEWIKYIYDTNAKIALKYNECPNCKYTITKSSK